MIPLGPELRAAINSYRGIRIEQGLPRTGPLFCYLDGIGNIEQADVMEIIRIAETLAKTSCHQDEHDPEDVFCSKVRPLHDCRTAVSNRHARLGWTVNKNQSYMTCASTNLRFGSAQDTDYRKLDPYYCLAIAEGKSLIEALQDSRAVELAKAEHNVQLVF